MNKDLAQWIAKAIEMGCHFEFHIANNPRYRIVCVIAWCEIPQFKE